MTNKDYKPPINPPPELFAEWLAEAKRLHPTESTGFIAGEVARLAYQAGADQELDACCKWVSTVLPQFVGNSMLGQYLNQLRAARRPKPPSLKEQALDLLDKAEDPSWDINDFSIVRRAVEALPDSIVVFPSQC
jgi:hypothetical protein